MPRISRVYLEYALEYTCILNNKIGSIYILYMTVFHYRMHAYTGYHCESNRHVHVHACNPYDLIGRKQYKCTRYMLNGAVTLCEKQLITKSIQARLT